MIDGLRSKSGPARRRVYSTFHVADAAIAFRELEVRRVGYFELDQFTVAAAFVQHFGTHGCTLVTPSL